MKIKTHKDSSGQCPCLSLFPRAASDQMIASHREWYKEKQTGHACPGASLELTQKWTAQLDDENWAYRKCTTQIFGNAYDAYICLHVLRG